MPTSAARQCSTSRFLQSIVFRREKHFGAPVAAPGYMVRQTGDDNPGKASMLAWLHAVKVGQT